MFATDFMHKFDKNEGILVIVVIISPAGGSVNIITSFTENTNSGKEANIAAVGLTEVIFFF